MLYQDLLYEYFLYVYSSDWDLNSRWGFSIGKQGGEMKMDVNKKMVLGWKQKQLSIRIYIERES